MLKKLKLRERSWKLNHKKRFLKDEGLKRLTICKKCHTFYYKNSWHFEEPRFIGNEHEEEVSVYFTECPACMEQELAIYETDPSLVLSRV